MKFIDFITVLLLVIGGLNWGLMGVANFNMLAGFLTPGLQLHCAYIIIGLAAVYRIIFWKKIHDRWTKKNHPPSE